jgi:hypothetical protein
MESQDYLYADLRGLIFCQEILPQHIARCVGRISSQVFATPPNPDHLPMHVSSLVIEMLSIQNIFNQPAFKI